MAGKHGSPFFNRVVVAQPAMLVYADLQEADQRRHVLMRLLAQIEASGARMPDIGSPVPYRYLKYDVMQDDLGPWLRHDRSLVARRITRPDVL
jgi:hypothetical protein